jgi:hypothetical protein
MCRTLKDSLDTFIISIVVARILYFSNEKSNQLQKTNAILLLSFCFIQLADFLIHYSIKNDYNTFNFIISRFLIPFILMSEIPIMYYATYKLTGKRMKWFEITAGILCIYGFLSYIYHCNQPSTQAKNGFLIWCNSPITSNVYKILFFLGIIIATYHYPMNIYKIVFLIIVTSTFIYTFNSDTFGSGWCHFANVLSIIWLLLFFIQKYI